MCYLNMAKIATKLALLIQLQLYATLHQMAEWAAATEAPEQS